MAGFLKKLFGFSRESSDTFVRQGIALFKAKQYDQAIAAFTEVLRLDPTNVGAHRWRSQAYAALGDEAKADADSGKVRELTRQVPAEKPVGLAFAKAMFFRTANYESEADCDEAIREITEAPPWVRENNPPAYHNRGLAYLQKGQIERALADFTEAIRLCPAAPDTYAPLRMRGRAFLRAGKYREAIGDFTQVLALEPGDVSVYGGRAAAYNELGEYDRAIVDSTEAIRRQPDSVLSYINRGFSYLKKAEYAAAIADYTEAIRLNPENLGLYEDRAKAYRASGDLARATADELNSQGVRQ